MAFLFSLETVFILVGGSRQEIVRYISVVRSLVTRALNAEPVC